MKASFCYAKRLNRISAPSRSPGTSDTSSTRGIWQYVLLMHKFLLWDHDGVLVDTEPLYFAATRESIRLLGLDIDQSEYLRLTTAGRTSWELARESGIPETAIIESRRERDRRYQEYLMTREIEIEGVIDVLTTLS